MNSDLPNSPTYDNENLSVMPLYGVNDDVELHLNHVPHWNHISGLSQGSDGFSYDSTWTRYGTLCAWSRTYGIPHNTLYRDIAWRKLPTYHGYDASARPTDSLYSADQMVRICVEFFHQSNLPTLSDDQTVSIKGCKYITRQGFAKLHHPKITWNRINRWAQEIQEKQGIKMAKYKSPTSIATHYYPIYPLSALEAYLWRNERNDIQTLTGLTGEVGKRSWTIPNWADYLQIGTEGLRNLLKNTSPTREVIVANNRVQVAYSEDVILDAMQKLCLSSAGKITIRTLEDWLLLPHAWTTDEKGKLIAEKRRQELWNLVNTTSWWSQEFPISEGALNQLIKRRKDQVAAIFGRSATRVVHLYTRNTIAEILEGKKPWGTKRKKKKKSR